MSLAAAQDPQSRETRVTTKGPGHYLAALGSLADAKIPATLSPEDQDAVRRLSNDAKTIHEAIVGRALKAAKGDASVAAKTLACCKRTIARYLQRRPGVVGDQK